MQRRYSSDREVALKPEHQIERGTVDRPALCGLLFVC